MNEEKMNMTSRTGMVVEVSSETCKRKCWEENKDVTGVVVFEMCMKSLYELHDGAAAGGVGW